MRRKKTNHDGHSLPYSWCLACGKDEFGDWADFQINKVTQRMRCLKPGTFLMGSPLDEPERFENETQHKVKLTHGFMMADTTCTQELWQAVMENNPSSFTGLNRPVENVSFEDCNVFFEIVNNKNKDLNLRLPTEAEWEYACRAGTQTAFCFGDEISSKQVSAKETSSAKKE